MKKGYLIIVIILSIIDLGLGSIYFLVPKIKLVEVNSINTNKQLNIENSKPIDCGVAIESDERPLLMTEAYKCFEEHGEKCQPAKYIESSGDGYHGYEVTVKGIVRDEKWQKKLCEEWKMSDYCSAVNPYPSDKYGELCLIEFKALESKDPLMVGKKANCYIPNNPIAIIKENALILYDPNRCEGDLIEYQLNNNPNFKFLENNFLKNTNSQVNETDINQQAGQKTDGVFNCGTVSDRVDMSMQDTPNYKCYEYYAEKCQPVKATLENEWFTLETEVKGGTKDKAKFDEVCSIGDMPTFCYTLNPGPKDELCVFENKLIKSKEFPQLEGKTSTCYVPNIPEIIKDENFMFNFYSYGCEGELATEYPAAEEELAYNRGEEIGGPAVCENSKCEEGEWVNCPKDCVTPNDFRNNVKPIDALVTSDGNLRIRMMNSNEFTIKLISFKLADKETPVSELISKHAISQEYILSDNSLKLNPGTKYYAFFAANFVNTQNNQPLESHGILVGQVISNSEPNPELGGFCGVSTYGDCQSDNNCVYTGANKVCKANQEEPGNTATVTGPVYPGYDQACHNQNTYNVNCSCVNNKCQWHK